jgi:hypothetical protein
MAGHISGPKGATLQEFRDFVLSVLDYDSETGHLTWKVRTSCRVKVGSIAGTRMKLGYLSVGVGGRSVYAHRLIWLMLHGRWPHPTIDHRNGDRLDNRLCNLREATYTQQNGNLPSNKKHGLKGAVFHKQMGRWVAQCQRRHLGCFDTELEAHEAYMAAAELAFGEFARRA